MKSKIKDPVVRDLVALGIDYYNARRICYNSKGVAASALVKLIQDLHKRGVLVTIT